MPWRFIIVCSSVIGLIWWSAPALAGPLDANNTPATATTLTKFQFVVSDDLNGNVGRPATILGEFGDSQYLNLLASDTDGSSLGNGQASQLIGVPLRFNGSAYFRVTGAPDVNFTGAQSQSGLYSYQFDIFDAQHNHIESIAPAYENVSAGMIDNIWLDPNGDPRRIGGTVDVTLNNVIGPGTGDSLDFFWFSGLQPFQAFTAQIDAATFPALIGLFNSANALVSMSDPADSTATLTGQADAQGRALIGVTGAPDTGFIGQHAEVGTYTLEIAPVNIPEPSSITLAVVAALAGGCWNALRRRGTRANEARSRATGAVAR
jgi:hypothetical protein